MGNYWATSTTLEIKNTPEEYTLECYYNSLKNNITLGPSTLPISTFLKSTNSFESAIKANVQDVKICLSVMSTSTEKTHETISAKIVDAIIAFHLWLDKNDEQALRYKLVLENLYEVYMKFPGVQLF